MRNDHTKLNLDEIVPEYKSKNFLVKHLFYSRLKFAIQMGCINRNSEIIDIDCGMAC